MARILAPLFLTLPPALMVQGTPPGGPGWGMARLLALPLLPARSAQVRA